VLVRLAMFYSILFTFTNEKNNKIIFTGNYKPKQFKHLATPTTKNIKQHK
jgi:hypothetical protein